MDPIPAKSKLMDVISRVRTGVIGWLFVRQQSRITAEFWRSGCWNGALRAQIQTMAVRGDYAPI
jgi:hypothetical protein